MIFQHGHMPILLEVSFGKAPFDKKSFLINALLPVSTVSSAAHGLMRGRALLSGYFVALLMVGGLVGGLVGGAALLLIASAALLLKHIKLSY